MAETRGGCRRVSAICADCGMPYIKAVRKYSGDRCGKCYYENVLKRKKNRERETKHRAKCGHVSPNYFLCTTCMNATGFKGHVLGQEAAI